MKKIPVLFLTLLFAGGLAAGLFAATRKTNPGRRCVVIRSSDPSDIVRGGKGRKFCCPKGSVVVGGAEGQYSCKKVYGSAEEEIAELRKKTEEKRQAAERARASADALGPQISEVQGKIGQLDGKIAQAKKDKEGYESGKMLTGLTLGTGGPTLQETEKTQTIGGASLTSVKGALDGAANTLDGIKQGLRRMGWKEEDIQKLVNHAGTDPERLAAAIRTVAETIKPEMNMDDLLVYQRMLWKRLQEAKSDEEKIKNTAARERAEVARYDADIAKAKGEWEASNKKRMDHDNLAGQYDRECREKGWTCAWNIPKAVWERSMAAIDQANMNRIDAWISVLNFGKFWPALAVTGSDFQASPYAFTRQLIEKQLKEAAQAKTDLQARIDAKEAEKDREDQKKKDELDTKIREEERKIAAWEGEKASLGTQLANLEYQKLGAESAAFQNNYEAEKAEERIAELEQKIAEKEGAVAAKSSRSAQSLSDSAARSAGFEKQIENMDAKIKVAERKLTQEKAKYQEWAQKKGWEKQPEKSRGKPKPVKPGRQDEASAKRAEGERVFENKLHAMEQRETGAWEHHKRKLQDGWVADQQKEKQKRFPLDQKLAQRDKELEEAKRKAAEAEAAMKKALAEAEAKKGKEGLAKKKALEEEAKRKEEEQLAKKKAEEELAKKKTGEDLARKQAEEAAKKKAEGAIAKKKALEEEAKRGEQEKLAKKKAGEELARKKAGEELAKKKAEEEAKRKEQERLAKKKAGEELARKQKGERERQLVEERARREKQLAEEQRRQREREELARRQREETRVPSSSGQYCNPNMPRYSQPGCIEPPAQEGPPPTQGQPCNPNVPRYSQPGCVE